MKAIIELVHDLRIKTVLLADDLAATYDIPNSSMPIAALNMVAQNIVMAVELLSFYDQVFPPPRRGRFEDFLHDHPEESQRIGSLLNSCFIESMSNFESCARRALRFFPKEYGPVAEKIYLINIMQRSRKLGWISNIDEKAWTALIELRNSLVHNNGVSSSNAVVVLPNGVTWSFLRGFQPEATLRHVPLTLDWAIGAFARWSNSFLRGWSANFDYAPLDNRYHSYKAFSGTRKIIPTWSSSTPSVYSTSVFR